MEIKNDYGRVELEFTGSAVEAKVEKVFRCGNDLYTTDCVLFSVHRKTKSEPQFFICPSDDGEYAKILDKNKRFVGFAKRIAKNVPRIYHGKRSVPPYLERLESCLIKY